MRIFAGRCSPSRRPKRERGFALLIVLWSLVVLGLLFTQILASGRTAMVLAGNLRGAAVARAGADGAISTMLFHLLSMGQNHWAPDGSPHALPGGGLVITVRAESLANRINPNLASTALLTGLWQAEGASPPQAQALAAAMIQWRSPPATKQAAAALRAAYRNAGLPYAPAGQPFDDLSELRDVIGMPEPLLVKALPELSLYQTDDPNRRLSDPIVRRALQLAGLAGSSASIYNGTVPVVSIEARADGPGGISVRRVAIVGLADADAPVPFTVLSLTDGQ